MKFKTNRFKKYLILILFGIVTCCAALCFSLSSTIFANAEATSYDLDLYI